MKIRHCRIKNMKKGKMKREQKGRKTFTKRMSFLLGIRNRGNASMRRKDTKSGASKMRKQKKKEMLHLMILRQSQRQRNSKRKCSKMWWGPITCSLRYQSRFA